MANEVIKSKFVDRDLSGYIVAIELNTTRKRTFRFDGREPALWANSHYQKLQSINHTDITVKYTIEH